MIGVRLSKTITYYTNQSPRGLNLYYSLETDSSIIFVEEISSIIHSKFGSFASGFRRIFFYQSEATIACGSHIVSVGQVVSEEIFYLAN